MKKLYVGHSNEIYFKNELYPAILESNLSKEFNIALPHKDSKLPFPSKEFLKNCTVMIAEGSEPSTGLGIEMGWADMLDVPILCIYKKGKKIAGSYQVITKDFIEYEDKTDLVQKINAFFNI